MLLYVFLLLVFDKVTCDPAVSAFSIIPLRMFNCYLVGVPLSDDRKFSDYLRGEGKPGSNHAHHASYDGTATNRVATGQARVYVHPTVMMSNDVITYHYCANVNFATEHRAEFRKELRKSLAPIIGTRVGIEKARNGVER